MKAIGAPDILKALESKNPWKNVKALGTNVRFQFILPEELQTQITRRAGKEAVGKPVKKGVASRSESDETITWIRRS